MAMIVRLLGWIIVLGAVPLSETFQFLGVEIFKLDPNLSNTSWGTIFLTGLPMLFWRD
jgi:hypothetical protein